MSITTRTTTLIKKFPSVIREIGKKPRITPDDVETLRIARNMIIRFVREVQSTGAQNPFLNGLFEAYRDALRDIHGHSLNLLDDEEIKRYNNKSTTVALHQGISDAVGYMKLVTRIPLIPTALGPWVEPVNEPILELRNKLRLYRKKQDNKARHFKTLFHKNKLQEHTNFAVQFVNDLKKRGLVWEIPKGTVLFRASMYENSAKLGAEMLYFSTTPYHHNFIEGYNYLHAFETTRDILIFDISRHPELCKRIIQKMFQTTNHSFAVFDRVTKREWYNDFEPSRRLQRIFATFGVLGHIALSSNDQIEERCPAFQSRVKKSRNLSTCTLTTWDGAKVNLVKTYANKKVHKTGIQEGFEEIIFYNGWKQAVEYVKHIATRKIFKGQETFPYSIPAARLETELSIVPQELKNFSREWVRKVYNAKGRKPFARVRK